MSDGINDLTRNTGAALRTDAPHWRNTAPGNYELTLPHGVVYLHRTDYPGDDPRWLVTCRNADVLNLLLDATELGPAKLEALRLIAGKLRTLLGEVEGAMP
jgi:hypothetical protein